MYPKDQNTDRKAAAMPAAVRYRVAGAVTAPVTTIEKARITAATVVHTSCPQKLSAPSLLK
jgi:hypothetical protein